MTIKLDDALSTSTAGQAGAMRQLNAQELDEVSGGILPLLGLVLCFEVGFLGGVIAANYKTTGNFWGDI